MSNKNFIAQRAGLITCVLAVVLIVIKAAAYALSGSLSVLASLTDSMMDGAVSAMNFFALRYSSKPADHDHRHGHGKIEGLAALVQATLMGGAAFYLLVDAWERWQHPHAITDVPFTLGVMVASVLLSFVIIFVQKRAIAQTQSLALEADNAHYSADIIQHGGVIIVLIASLFGAPLWLDIICGSLIAILMLGAARHIGAKAVDMILDRELPGEERHWILDQIKAHPQVLGVHDLRATRSGMKELILFDIEADPQLSLAEAHNITRALETVILERYPSAEIMVHVDPHGEIEDSRHSVADVHH